MVIYQRVKRAQKLGSFPLLRENTWRPSVKLTDYQRMIYTVWIPHDLHTAKIVTQTQENVWKAWCLVKNMSESFINQNQGLRRHSDKMSAEILPKYLAIYSAVWRSLQSAKNLFEKKPSFGVRSPWWNSFSLIGREVRFLKQVVFIACL